MHLCPSESMMLLYTYVSYNKVEFALKSGVCIVSPREGHWHQLGRHSLLAIVWEIIAPFIYCTSRTQ